MKINLLSKRYHNILGGIFLKYPKLTLQNKGYQYIAKDSLSELELKAHRVVEEILRKHIEGFREFNNFKTRESGEVVLRFQYKWDWKFTGVGYITVNELLKGFKDEKK